jgi:hypothetical protein
MAKEDKPLRLHELREKLIKTFGSGAKMALKEYMFALSLTLKEYIYVHVTLS